MNLSEKGVTLLHVREGCRLKAYKDTVGVWTIGYGHTGPEVVAGLQWSQAQADEAFLKDVRWAEDEINTVPGLTQYQFDALVSFVFNVGASAFRKSTMKKKLLLGDFQAAEREFDRWVIPKEITGRRMSEKHQFAGA